jgi:glycosyltransferase involved in cell wall biosynthesis
VNILVHCIYFRPEVGGLESHVHQLCKGFAERGHKVDLVTSQSVKGTPKLEMIDGVNVWRTWFPSRSPAGWILHSFGSVPRLRERARVADVIHAQAFASVVPGALARRVSGAPLVVTYHTSHFLRRAERARWRPVLSRLVRMADHNLAASREIAAVAESLAPGVDVEALTNGVDTDLFTPGRAALPPKGRARLVVPRRLFAKNGVEFLVRAMPRIVERVDAEALLVGDGPERGRLEALAEELGVAGRVRFLGARPYEEMPGLLRSGEVAVFPSLMEATSVAALESMACEVPVAASRVGGLPEIVDETVGTLFEPADPDDLADAVVRLLSSSDLADRGAQGRRRVLERWSNDRLVDRHLEIYRSLAGRRA